MMKKYLVPFLLLASCSAEPAYAQSMTPEAAAIYTRRVYGELTRSRCDAECRKQEQISNFHGAVCMPMLQQSLSPREYLGQYTKKAENIESSLRICKQYSLSNGSGCAGIPLSWSHCAWDIRFPRLPDSYNYLDKSLFTSEVAERNAAIEEYYK